MDIESVVETINTVLDSVDIAANSVPPFLLKCSSMDRSGLSAYKIATKVIEQNKLVGIPTEPNQDGSENLINLYTYNIAKAIVDALQNDASVQIAIPMESLMIQANGANAGGAVTTIGTNILDSVSKGIIV